MYATNLSQRECRKILPAVFIFLFSFAGLGQSGNCDPNTPFFICNLSNNLFGTWVSNPPVIRNGNCCGTVAPDKCIEFEVTLDSQAVGINFNIASGAVPPGALFYQINCGPQVAVGSPICLNGPGPYTLTFCKPGNNTNTYSIVSFGPPAVSPDDTVGNGCTALMYASGVLEDNTITWNSVYPGAYGAYNSYLSCTQGCDTTVVTGQPTAPPYVDYVVCGTPLAAACAPNPVYCDTIRIYFTPPVVTVINPLPAVYCAGDSSGIALTASASGGVPPYTYAWLSPGGTVISTSLTYTATSPGNYSFVVYDQNYPTCPAHVTPVPVLTTPVPIVNAGADQVLCGTTVQLNASITNATGGVWSGGGGTYFPGNTSLNAVYTPSAAELTAGTFTLTLTSTGNGACPAESDQVAITIAPTMTVSISGPPLLCYGQTTTLTATTSGGMAPFNYLWTGGQTGPVYSNVPAGTYSVTVTAPGAGCVATASIVVSSPPAIALSYSSVPTSCGLNNGAAAVTANGGTGAFSYSWTPGAINGPTASNQAPGSYTVAVSDANNCPAQIVANISVGSVLPTANFSVTSACLNNANTFTDLSSGNGDVLGSWQWNFGEPGSGASNTSTLQNPGHTYSTAGTFTATLIVSTTKGCSDTLQIPVVVHPLPIVNFSWTSPCGAPTVFTNTATISSGTINNWTWNFDDLASGSANISLQVNPTHVYTAPGVYQVLLTATSDQGCQGSLVQPVTVPGVPQAAFTFGNGCRNAPIQFTDASQISFGSLSAWSWDFGDGTTASNVQHPAHTYTANGTYSVTLIVTSAAGCKDTVILPVTIQQAATAGFSAPAVCLNAPTSFTNITTLAFGSITSCSWNFGDFSSGSSNMNPVHCYSVAGTFNVTLNVLTSDGCTASITEQVTVHPNPVADFTAQDVCLNSPTVFNDASTISSGSIQSWQWGFGDGSPVITISNPSYLYQQPATYMVTLVVTSSYNCVDTASRPVNIHPLPQPAFAVTNSVVCLGSCTQFNDQSTVVNDSIVVWRWNFGDGSNDGMSTNPVHCYAETGNYAVTLTVETAGGCSAKVTYPNFVQVFPVPKADFTFNPSPVTIFNPEVNFVDQSQTAWAWHWDFGDPNDPTASQLQHPSHTYADTGSYSITLVVENIYRCRDTSVRTLRIDPEFTFYIPNAFTPGTSFGTNDQFGAVGGYIKEFEMRIFDRWGNMIYYSKDINEKWDGKVKDTATPAQEDVYVYKVELYDVGGELHRYSGVINLIR